MESVAPDMSEVFYGIFTNGLSEDALDSVCLCGECPMNQIESQLKQCLSWFQAWLATQPDIHSSPATLDRIYRHYLDDVVEIVAMVYGVCPIHESLNRAYNELFVVDLVCAVNAPIVKELQDSGLDVHRYLYEGDDGLDDYGYCRNERDELVY